MTEVDVAGRPVTEGELTTLERMRSEVALLDESIAALQAELGKERARRRRVVAVVRSLEAIEQS